MINADRKVQTRARKARDKVKRMVTEITAWKGEKPKVVRVSMSDYLALTECDWLTDDGRLSGTMIEVKPG